MSVLARSGNLAAAKILHNRIFILYDVNDVAREEKMELVLFDDTAFLCGEKLYFVYFDKLLRCVRYSYGKGEAHRAGALYFANDYLTVSGTVLGSDGKLRQVVGCTTQTVFDAVIKDDQGRTEAHTLTIGATTDPLEDGVLQGTSQLRAFYKLDGEDITSTTACTGVDPVTWETTISKIQNFSGFEPVDKVSFSIVVDFTGTKFKGDYQVNSPLYGPISYSFTGEARADCLRENRAVDRDWRERDGEALERCPHPDNLSMELRESCALASEPSLLELLNINPIEIVRKDNKEYPIDHAQQKAMEYFQNILVGKLDSDTVETFFGSAPTLTENVKKISEAYAGFYQKYAKVNMAQILYDNCRTTGSKEQKAACERIKTDVIQAKWEAAAQNDPDYTAQANALYLEGYRDGVQSIAPYLVNGVQWAEELADYLKSNAFLNMWRVQIASLLYDNVKERIYGFYSKLLVLDSSEDGQKRAQDVLGVLFSSICTAGGFLAVYTEETEETMEELLIAQIESVTKYPEKLPDTIRELAQLYRKVVGTFMSVNVFAAQFISALAKLAKSTVQAADAPLVSLVSLAGDELAKENQNFQNIWKQASKTNICKLLGATLSVAGAAFMVYCMVTTGQKDTLSVTDIVLELSLGEVALTMLIKGGEYIMESKLGGWIAGKLTGSASKFGNFAEGFSKWFTEEGIASDHALARFFGKNSRTFCQRFLGPAMIITAIVLGALVLNDAIKTGETREIVLDALNLVALTGELVSWGVAMCGFTWAGTMGIAFAVIGGLVLLIQLVWSLFSPPKGPVEQYVDNKLVPAGLASK